MSNENEEDGVVSFVESFSGVAKRLEKISEKPKSEIDKAEDVSFNILASRAGITSSKLKSPSDYLNIDKNVKFTESEIYLALWALSYSKAYELSYKSALDILIKWLSAQSESDQEKLMGSVMFSEAANMSDDDVEFFSIVEQVSRATNRAITLNTLKYKAYQAGTGCDFMEAVMILK
jgi:hypothetical protein